MPTDMLFGSDNNSWKLCSGIIGDYPLGNSAVLFDNFLKKKKITSLLVELSYSYMPDF